MLGRIDLVEYIMAV